MPGKKKTNIRRKTAAKLLSRRTERLLRFLLLIIPVLFFVFLEIALRQFNYGNDYPVFIPSKANPGYYIINPELGKRYFPATGVTPQVAYTDAFLKYKPRRGFRIFVLGGSTAAGYPYLYNASFSSILKVILKTYYPKKYIEIVNLSMPAVSSYTIRDIALELAEYKPDLLLVYSGHNEFYGGLGVGSTESLGNSRWLINLYLKLSRYKTFQLMRNALSSIRGWNHNRPGEAPAPGGTLMERMARNRYIPFGSDLIEKAGENFQGNITDVLEFCQRRHIPLLIGTLVSNVRHHQPFVDVFSNLRTKEIWAQQFNSAKKLFAQQKYDEALSAVNRCIKQDSLPASQYFLKGEILEGLDDTIPAYNTFYRAKEFDGLRFRASEDLNTRIYQLGKTAGVTVVPVKEAFETQSSGRLPGNSLFLEHLHPNLRGYILMAKQFAKTIIKTKIVDSLPYNQLPDSMWVDKIGVTDVDLEAGNIRVNFLKKGWPFSNASPLQKDEFKIEKANFIQKLALQFWREEINWEQMHVKAAEYYSKQKQWVKAEQEYRALINATPRNSSPYIFLGKLLVKQKKLGQALETFQNVLKIEEDAYSYKMAGKIHLINRQAEAAIVYLEKAVQLAPGDWDALLHLAKAFVQKGDLSKADKAVQQILRSNRDYPQAKKLAEYITRKISERGKN